MGRPQKDGLDYFPLDVHMDDSIALVEADYGVEGFGIIIKLYQQIYANGYFLEVDDRRIKLISRLINIDIDLLKDVMESAVSENIFNQKLYKKYKILTSKGIQKRYLFASLRRLSANFYKEYLLLGVNDNINSINVSINSINTVETPVNDSSNKHIILKDTILKNTIEVIDYFNKITSQKRRYSKSSKDPISARLSDNYSMDDCKSVIDKKYKEWSNSKDMAKHITIETFFRPSNFEKYLNQDVEESSSGVFVDDYSPIRDAPKQEYLEVCSE